MNAVLRLKKSVSICSRNLECNRFDTCFVSIKKIKYFCCEALSFSPSCIHTIEHACPVASLCTACTGIKSKDYVIFVIRLVKKVADPDILKSILKLIKLCSYLGSHIIIIDALCVLHIDKVDYIAVLLVELINSRNKILHVLKIFGLLVCLLCVIPKSGLLHLTAELFYYLFLIIQIKRSRHLFKCASEILNFNFHLIKYYHYVLLCPIRDTLDYSVFLLPKRITYTLPQQFLYFLPLPQGQGSLG